uniref:Uncharacterized protein n=1 Tax=Anguilla anguilla TaxID=7936 RepID=A0A0E9TXD1_ANGAN
MLPFHIWPHRSSVSFEPATSNHTPPEGTAHSAHHLGWRPVLWKTHDYTDLRRAGLYSV